MKKQKRQEEEDDRKWEEYRKGNVNVFGPDTGVVDHEEAMFAGDWV